LKDAIATQARAFASEGAYQDFVRAIVERPDFADLKEFLFLPSVRDVEYAGHAPAGLREEGFASAAAEKIPGVRRSSRGYMAAMDSLRVQAWDSYMADLAGNPNVTRDTYKALGELVNITTGRGVVPVLDRSQFGRKVVTLLNNPLWSPRAMAARFNMLSPYRILENSVNPATRSVALLQLRDSARALTTVGTTMALLSQVPGVRVGLNPFKPDWGKIVIGRTRYDLIDGVPATAKFVAQMSRAFYQKAEGKPYDVVRGVKQTPKLLAVVFLRRRLSPSGQVAANAYTGKTVEGEPFTRSGAARDLLVPFVVDGLYQGWLDAGGSSVSDVVAGRPVKTAFRGALKGAPSLIGIPSSTYKTKTRGGSQQSSGESSPGEVFYDQQPTTAKPTGGVLPPDQGQREITDDHARRISQLLDSLDDGEDGGAHWSAIPPRSLLSKFVKGLGEFEGMGRLSPLADATSYVAEKVAPLIGAPKSAEMANAMRLLARERRLRPAQFNDDVKAGRYGQSFREAMGGEDYYKGNR
jgi:hypothetical protein